MIWPVYLDKGMVIIINGAGLHSAVQEDNCMFLSISYIYPHFDVN